MSLYTVDTMTACTVYSVHTTLYTSVHTTLYHSPLLRILMLNVAIVHCWQTRMICSLAMLTRERVLLLKHAMFLIGIHGDQSH